MEVLLRQLRPGRDGTIEYQDTEISAELLTLGSAADCTIQLLGEAVAPHHAAIRARSLQLRLQCLRRNKAVLNGKSVSSASLQVGDLVEIGGHRLRRLEPPGGFAFALELDPDTKVSTSAYERAFGTDLSRTWLSKRRAAWVLILIIVGVGLAIPYSSITRQRAGAPLLPVLPTDRIWSAGMLIPPHELAAGQRCGSCHEQLFVHVRDSACRECHHSIADHVPAAHLAGTQLGPTQRCAECHREHHAMPAGLVMRDDGLCVDCHAKSDVAFGPLKVQKVQGFSRATHPAFTVSLLKPGPPDETGVAQWRVRREPVATAREQSNLKFSHAQHLDPAQVTRASDRGTLGCSDCHSLAADGEHFIPITMQRACASCHELTFDSEAPDRQLPHGKPRDTILLIQDYFVRKAVDPNPARAAFQRRRLPDQQPAPVTCSDASYTCAMRRAQAEIENQFTGRGCVSCHDVNDRHSRELLDRFEVRPVRLTRDYFPKVRFSHRLHAVQKDKSGDAACLSCHAVKASKSSADLFIPDLPKCLECHSERLVTDRVTLQCSSCHSYHPTTTPDPTTMPDRIREADAQ